MLQLIDYLVHNGLSLSPLPQNVRPNEKLLGSYLFLSSQNLAKKVKLKIRTFLYMKWFLRVLISVE
jgi:hypothetical protein